MRGGGEKERDGERRGQEELREGGVEERRGRRVRGREGGGGRCNNHDSLAPCL